MTCTRTPRRMRSAAGSSTVLALLLLLSSATCPLLAQSIQGRLLETGTGQPIIVGRVILFTEGVERVSQTVSDQRGHFRLTAPGPGRFLVYAERLGYFGSFGRVSLAPSEVIEVELRLSPRPVALDSVSVATEARVAHLARAGFYAREQIGFGHFITRDEIERWNPRRASELLLTVPGVYLNRSGVYLRGAAAASLRGPRPPRIYLDGMPVLGGLDQVIRPEDIEALEVYRGASELPAQYGGAESACGVVLVWTRQ